MNLRLISFLSLACLLGAPKLCAQSLFPDRCTGRWQGTLYLYKQGLLQDSLPVRLTVTPTAEPRAWTWRTDYLAPQKPVVKDYILRLKDQAANRYVTDEQDGTQLDAYLVGNKLYSAFETAGSLVTASYELRNDRLIFEVTSGRKAGPAGPAVVNYSVTSVQRVEFRREAAKK